MHLQLVQWSSVAVLQHVVLRPGSPAKDHFEARALEAPRAGLGSAPARR